MRRAPGLVFPIALGVGAGLLALVLPRYRRAIRHSRRNASARAQVVRTSRGPIEYAVIGDGPPVLVVHGAGGGFDQGLELGAPLAAQGFRVIAVSRFGYLGTPLPPDASAAAQADAYAAMIDALDIRRVAVVGFSAGAPSSLQFALRHPERTTALGLVVPAAFVPRPGGGPSVSAPAAGHRMLTAALRSDFLFWLGIEYARSTMIEAILGTPASAVQRAGATEQARVDAMLHHILPVSARRLGLLNDAAVVSSLERYPLERINVPTLVVSAADDKYGTFDCARYTAEHIPGGRFVGFEDGGHLLVGHQETLTREVVEFLTRRARAGESAPEPLAHATVASGTAAP